MISSDLKKVKARSGSFDKKIGDTVNLDNVKYTVFQLHENLVYAKACLGMFDFSLHLDLAKRNLNIK